MKTGRFTAHLAALALAFAACDTQTPGAAADAPEAPAAAAAASPAPVAPTPSPAVPAPAQATSAPDAVRSPAAPAASSPALYLDVRTPEEYAAGHVEGSVLIPYDQIAARAAELEPYRNRDIVVYCRTGRRAGVAIDALRALGFTRLENGGGFEQLAHSRSLPVEPCC